MEVLCITFLLILQDIKASDYFNYMTKSLRFAMFLSAIFLSVMVNGQDIIVRISGDTLFVKIDSNNDSFYYYFDNNRKKNDLQVISRKEVAEVIYGFNTDYTPSMRYRAKSGRDYEMIHVGLQYAGYFLDLSSSSDAQSGLKEYYDKLRFGSGLLAYVDVFFNKSFGVGGVYSMSKFHNSALVEVTYHPSDPLEPPIVMQGDLADNMRFNYYGVGGVFRHRLGDSQSDILITAGIGLHTYQNEGKLIYDYELKGHGLGFHIAGHFNLGLGDGIYLPVSLGYMGRTVQNLSVSYHEEMPDILRMGFEATTTKTAKISVDRIFIGVGLSLSF